MLTEQKMESVDYVSKEERAEYVQRDEVNKFWNTYSKGLIINQNALLNEGITEKTLLKWKRLNFIKPRRKNSSSIIFTSVADSVANSLVNEFIEEEKAERSLFGAADLAELRSSDRYFENYLKGRPDKKDRISTIKQQIINIVTLNDNKKFTPKERAEKLNVTNEEYEGLLKRIGLIVENGYFNLAKEPEFDKVQISMMTMSQMSGFGWNKIAIRLYPFIDQVKLPKNYTEIKNAKFPFNIFSQCFEEPLTTTPIGNWLTLSSISEKLGVYYLWILNRVYKMPKIGEFRVGYKKRTSLCFPEEIVSQLEKQLYQVYDPEHEFNISYMAEKVGRHDLWVKKQIRKMDVEPVIRRDVIGKVTKFYSQSVLDKLHIESDKFKKGEGLMTIPMLAKAIAKDREWVVSTLTKLNIEGSYRRFEKKGRRGRTYICYTEEALNALKAQTKDCIPAENGWYTLNGLVHITGRSTNWVTKKIVEMNIAPQKRLDSRGNLRSHYPPEVYTKLQQLSKVG